MALINCPECGRENVSDSAEMCPDCGYGIKSHYDKINKEKLEKQLRQRKMDSITMPIKPEKPFTNLPFLGKFIIGFFVFAIILGGLYGYFIPDSKGWVLSIWGIGAIIMFYSIEYSNYNKKLKKYNSAKENFEKYQIEEFHRLELNEAEEKLKPKCPQCTSTNIERISTTSRMMSLATVGLASGKIGKQYKCKNCGNMW